MNSKKEQKDLVKLIGISLGFHLSVIGFFVAFYLIKPAHTEQVPVIMDLIQVPSPQPKTSPAPPAKQVISKPKPVAPTPPIQKAIPKPAPKKQAPVKKAPSPHIVKAKETIKPTRRPQKSVAKKEPTKVVEKKEDWGDLPDFDESAKNRSGNISNHPLLNLYQQQIRRVMMQNFRPPSGLQIPAGSKPIVAFRISRSGTIENISLMKSCGNQTLDRLALRAVRVAKLPPLPPTWKEDYLPIDYGFEYVP